MDDGSAVTCVGRRLYVAGAPVGSIADAQPLFLQAPRVATWTKPLHVGSIAATQRIQA